MRTSTQWRRFTTSIPVVNVRTLKRCVDAYERFCIILTNDGSAA